MNKTKTSVRDIAITECLDLIKLSGFVSVGLSHMWDLSKVAALKEAEDHGCDHCMTCLLSGSCNFKRLREGGGG